MRVHLPTLLVLFVLADTSLVAKSWPNCNFSTASRTLLNKRTSFFLLLLVNNAQVANLLPHGNLSAFSSSHLHKRSPKRKRRRRPKNKQNGEGNNVQKLPKAGGSNSTGIAADASFCAKGVVVADGTQKKTTTCSVTVQGNLPSADQMVSSVIIAPDAGSTIKLNAEVQVQVKTLNMELGFFDDPNSQYFTTPQTLNDKGIIQGHQHITVQPIGDGKTPPDPSSDALTFFLGLNDKDNDGVLEAVIPVNTFNTAGVFRICTITGTRGHQPVIMPIAKRGSQDDCIRVKVE